MTWLKKALLPLLGVVAVAVLIAQARGRAAPKTAVVAPSGPARIRAEGRVSAYPGAEVVVGTDYSGTLVRLLVDEKSRVRRGDVVAEIRADVERAALAEARARVGEADADLAFSEAELDRNERLAASGSITTQLAEKTRRDREAALARRESARAEVRRLSAVIGKTRIRAPIDGVVIARHVQPGETVPAGAHLLTIADLSHLRVEAEVDEFDAGRVAVGQRVEISAEGWKGTWAGRIEDIPDAVGPRRLKPQDPGRPSDTRVLLVKVAFTERVPLKLGQRVEVAIDQR